MLWSLIALLAGVVILALSADRFVAGAAALAKRLGMPPLLIGIVILGFGTSTPEMIVSSFAAWQGNPGLALGNALGSNITNIALIIGLSALISPIAVKSSILRTELPYLIVITAITFYFLHDAGLSRFESFLLLIIFVFLIGWSIYEGMRHPSDILATEVETALQDDKSLLTICLSLGFGLFFLVAGSRLLVWGGVELARFAGISDLVIGLTIVAIGTSLPELAATIVSVRKNENDLAMGNIIGSNLFNTTMVIGIAGVIHPFNLDPAFLTRDLPVLAILTVALFLMGSPVRNRPGRINRWEGATLLATWIIYMTWIGLTAS